MTFISNKIKTMKGAGSHLDWEFKAIVTVCKQDNTINPKIQTLQGCFKCLEEEEKYHKIWIFFSQ